MGNGISHPNGGSYPSYEEFYNGSLKSLSDKLLKLGGNNETGRKTIIVALGRKGVKLLEHLINLNVKGLRERSIGLGEEPQVFPDVVSEHALPFISRKDRNTGMVYSLMDDALYYGSSARGVAREVYAFENIYGISGHADGKICFYSAIDTEEFRPNFDRYIASVESEPVRKAGYGPGYSHFFAKRLSKDIRALENTFEIEFPVVTYTLDRRIEKNSWRDSVAAAYYDETEAKVYIVDHEENYSINILQGGVKGCSFNKVRIFPNNSKEADCCKENRVKVISMSPYPISDDDYLLEHLFDNANEGYRALWKEIFDRCHITTSDTNADNIMDYLNIARWRCNKSLVIMANYLMSFSNFVRQSGRLEKAFQNAGLTAQFNGIDAEKDLYYLLGDKDFCRKVAEQLEAFYTDGTECGDVSVNDNLSVDYTVFENSRNVDESIATLIRIQDEYMLEKSQNVEEALGALFYNQDVFYEKQVLAGNPVTQDFNRLRMGYTFEALRKTIYDSIKRNLLKLGKNEDVAITLHRWMDQRIGEASIVPQYILDEKSRHWVRVFRHGENEEPLLGHLARFVLLVYLEWNEQTRLGWIRKDLFQKLLAAAYNVEGIDNRKEQIVECTNINICTDDKGELVFTNNHYGLDEAAGKPHSVLQYMIDMCILSEEVRDRITIHKRANFFIQPGITTMEDGYEKEIRKKVMEEASSLLNEHKTVAV